MNLSMDTNSKNDGADITARITDYLYNVQYYLDAFKHIAMNTSWKASVQHFENNLLINIAQIIEEVKAHSYIVQQCKTFTTYERGKIRHIQAPSTKDKILLRNLCHNILIPILKNHLIYDNSASIPGRGISFARKRILTHLHKYYSTNKTNEGYILQLDFSKFFDTIDHELLIKEFKKYITQPDVIYLIETFINAFPNDKGVGIGSEISQIAGILFPNRIDQYCKTVKGCKYYGRYMDDIYIIHHDKKFLQEMQENLFEIAKELKLVFNPKKCHISKISKNFTFMKGVYHITESGAVMYKPHSSSLRRARKRFNRIKKNPHLSGSRNMFKAWQRCVYRQFPKAKSLLCSMNNKYLKDPKIGSDD